MEIFGATAYETPRRLRGAMIPYNYLIVWPFTV